MELSRTTVAAAEPTQGYVAAAMRRIDLSKPNIVLFMTGIGEGPSFDESARPKVAPYFDAASTSLSEVPYANVSIPSVGAASGQAVLTEVVEQVRTRAPNARILLMGISLGAWAIGDVLAENPAVAQAVAGAALVAHTNLAKAHYPSGTGNVREFNVAGDRFSMPFRGSRAPLLSLVDDLYTGITPGKVARGIPQIAQNVPMFAQFAKWMLGKPTPHDHAPELYGPAAAFLAGLAAGNA